MLQMPQIDVIDTILSLMWFPLMVIIPFVLGFSIIKVIKGTFVDDSYKSSSKFIGSSSSNKSSKVNLSKNNYSNSSSRNSSSSSSS
ncbi:RNA-binding protein, partial [Bacillus thuringiensis]|nr:RNA-binding protein [Bacillus thuringiensis]